MKIAAMAWDFVNAIFFVLFICVAFANENETRSLLNIWKVEINVMYSLFMQLEFSL